jgi:Uma2 family endonuclease
VVAEVKLTTAKEYAAMPEQNALIELIGGEIVAPPPTPEHQDISANLRDFLVEVAKVRGFGRWYYAPVGLYVSAYDVFEPDLMLFAPDQRPGKHENPVQKIPLIVIEILSLSNRGNDLIKKLPRYPSRGIPEYWIVDPSTKSIRINLLDESGNYLRVPIGEGPIQVGLYKGVVLPLDDIFAE